MNDIPENSILNDIKTYCNLMPEYTAFDKDIIDITNGVLSILVQLGIVSPDVPMLTDYSMVWTAWIPDEAKYAVVKMYVKSKVRMIFDPPANSDLRQSLQDFIDECEWRGFIEADVQAYL